jgi:hypothetical protein
MVWVRERTIPTERPPLVGEVIANFWGWMVPRSQRDGSLRPYSRFSRQEPLLFYQVAPQLYSRGWVDSVTVKIKSYVNFLLHLRAQNLGFTNVTLSGMSCKIKWRNKVVMYVLVPLHRLSQSLDSTRSSHHGHCIQWYSCITKHHAIVVILGWRQSCIIFELGTVCKRIISLTLRMLYLPRLGPPGDSRIWGLLSPTAGPDYVQKR